MAATSTCSKCGVLLSDDARQGFCPKCLFLQANAGKVAEDGTRVSGSFEDYELLEVVGQGGMGLVYRARQRSLDRVVAVKMMAFGPGANPELVKRFRAEAVAAAALQHPNIVAIHEVGIHDGRHFFVMDYVQGQSLAELAGSGPLPPRRAAGYLKTIAEAVHYAHERGILHRDLKPSNVLVDGENRPRVVDFGLARRLEGNSELTATGQVLGSPNYLPPEQATAQHGRVSRRTDVYGLGATLYHLLTGRPPFQAESLAETLDLVLHAEPVPPRLLNPALPRDLETICLKCLEKEPAKRYPTAQALAEDLDRYLDGLPILARPIGRAGKAWRWCRRNPNAAALGALAALALLLGMVGVLEEWGRAEVQRRRAEAGELSAQRRAYISEVYSAQQALKVHNPGRALELLNRHRPAPSTRNRQPSTDLRGFEWRFLWQQCLSDAEALIGRTSSPVRALEVSSDGQWLVAGTHLGGVTVWSLATGEEIALAAERGVTSCATFSRDARLLLFGDQSPEAFGTIVVWDLQARKRLAPIVDPERPIGPMICSPDGQYFAYGVALESPTKGRFGKALVVLRAYPGRDKVCEVPSRYDIVDKQQRQGWDIAFAGDSRSVIFGESDPGCHLVVRGLGSGSDPRYVASHPEPVTAMAASPDGRLLATGVGYTDTDIRLWELPGFRLAAELRGHEGWISSLRFSPDGRTLASASGDQTIRLWDVGLRTPAGLYAGLPSAASRLCFAPDGRKLYSGAEDGTIRRWTIPAPSAQSRTNRWLVPDGLSDLALSPDGKRFAALRRGTACLGELRSATPPDEVPELGTNNTCVLFSGDGRIVFAGTGSGEVQVWSLERRSCLGRLRGPPERVGRLKRDPHNRVLLAMHWPIQARLGRLPVRIVVWNCAGWHQQKAWTISGSSSAVGVFSSAEVSPDGRWLVTCGGRHPVQAWSLTDNSEPRTVPAPGITLRLAISPDGRLLATASPDGMVRVWELSRLRELTAFQARSRAILALAFSLDSRRLVTAGAGAETINVWDVVTWQELMALELPGENLDWIAFSTDDSALIAANDKGNILFWRAPSFAEIEAREKNEGLR